jgi:single-strand DNA-binding protein
MFQKVTIVGNLGKDPEMRYTPSGQPVTTFNVATNRTWKGENGETQKETTWFRVSAWGKRAESCNNFLHKGSKVLVEGRLTPSQNGKPRIFKYDDGTAGANYDVTASTVQFLDSRQDAAPGAPAGDEDGDDIPF